MTTDSRISKVIAETIAAIIVAARDDAIGRIFLKVDRGFDGAVYREILGHDLGDVDVRTVGLVNGFERFQIEEDRTATWYRNRQVDDEAGLVLLFLERAPDWQSLKDMVSITEEGLLSDWLDVLVGVAFSDYVLSDDQRRSVSSWLRDMLADPEIHDPAIHEVVKLLLGANDKLARYPELGLAKAFGESLPAVRLFADTHIGAGESAGLNWARLRENAKASQLRFTVPTQKELNEIQGGVRDRIDAGQLSVESGDDLLSLAAPIKPSESNLDRIFASDWSVVRQAFGKGRRKRNSRKESLGKKLREHLVTKDQFDDVAKSFVGRLDANDDPEESLLEDFIASHLRSLPKPLARQVRSLSQAPQIKSDDLLYLVTAGLLAANDSGSLQKPIQVKVRSSDESIEGKAARHVIGVCWPELSVGDVDCSTLGEIDWAAYDRWVDSIDTGDAEREFELPLIMTDSGENGTSVELDWTLRLGGPYEQLVAPFSPASIAGRVPAYESSLSEVGVVNLESPGSAFGAWYANSMSVRDAVIADIEPVATALEVDEVRSTLSQLDSAWESLEVAVGSFGLTASAVSKLFLQLDQTQQRLEELSGTPVLASRIFRSFARAWSIQFDNAELVVVPATNPVKMLWHLARFEKAKSLWQRYLDGDDDQAIDSDTVVRLFREQYSSRALPGLWCRSTPGDAHWCVPDGESGGFESYRPIVAATNRTDVEYGGAERYGRLYSSVIERYLDAYPYASDGMDIAYLDAAQVSTPLAMLEQIAKRRSSVRVDLAIHSSAPSQVMYEQMIEMGGALVDGGEGIPLVTARLVSGSEFDALDGRRDHDIVVLPHILSDSIETVEVTGGEIDANDEVDFGPVAFAPYAPGQLSRELPVNSSRSHFVVQRCLDAQHFSRSQRVERLGARNMFHRRVNIGGAEELIAAAHQNATWVVIYDKALDRQLLQGAFGKEIRIIRSTPGLGERQAYALTVSAGPKSEAVVRDRLQRRLAELLDLAGSSEVKSVVDGCMDAIREISGDLILRAGGEGTALHELIGLAASVRRQSMDDESTAWISLDDYMHWFGKGVRPDACAINLDFSDGKLTLKAVVLESKCVGEQNLDREITSGSVQLAAGLSLLSRAWQPGAKFVDSDYWYSQLVAALGSSRAVSQEMKSDWPMIRSLILGGEFEFEIRGALVASCHDTRFSAATILRDHDGIEYSIDRVDRDELRALLLGYRGEEGPQIAPPHSVNATVLESIDKGLVPSMDGSASEAATSSNVIAPVSASTVLVDDGDELATDPELADARLQGARLDSALRDFGIRAHSVDPGDAVFGPRIMQLRFKLGPGQTMSKLISAAPDIGRELALPGAPFVQHVPNTNYIGVDVPRLSPISYEPDFSAAPPETKGMHIPTRLGMNVEGVERWVDLASITHLLVAGSTGSGKSMFLQGLLLGWTSLLDSSRLQLVIVDPKRTDFAFMDGHPSLLTSLVLDPALARDQLARLAADEMPRRQELLRAKKAVNISQLDEADRPPRIVVIVDEYAQLVSMLAKKPREEFEVELSRLAQVGRSTGIHLIIAMQRPSAEVLSSVVKANLPAVACFRVATATNSRVALDENGGETLLGKGDMLFRDESGSIERLQAPFVAPNLLFGD